MLLVWLERCADKWQVLIGMTCHWSRHWIELLLAIPIAATVIFMLSITAIITIILLMISLQIPLVIDETTTDKIPELTTWVPRKLPQHIKMIAKDR